jgi:hypothetical protein
VALLELPAPVDSAAHNELAFRHGKALAEVVSRRAWFLHVVLPKDGYPSPFLGGVLYRLGVESPNFDQAPDMKKEGWLLDAVTAELRASPVPAGDLMLFADGRAEFQHTVRGSPGALPLAFITTPPDAGAGDSSAGAGDFSAGAGDSGVGAGVLSAGAGAGDFSAGAGNSGAGAGAGAGDFSAGAGAGAGDFSAGAGAGGPLSSAVGPAPAAAAPAPPGGRPLPPRDEAGAPRAPLTKLEDLLR